MAYYRKG